jgi:putative ABC transport system permease protein
MTFRTLIRRSLRFHWRAHLGVLLGAAVGSAALIGALVVGDSVRESLRERALERVGWVDAAMDLRDRLIPTTFYNGMFVRPYTNAADRVVDIQQDAAFAVLHGSGTISRQDGRARANQVTVLGIPSSKYFFFDPPDVARRNRTGKLWNANSPPGSVTVNVALAEKLHVQPGDEVILRLSKPSTLSREAVVSPRGDATASLRLRVDAIVGPDRLGNFSLQQSQSPPLNAFVDRTELNQALGLKDKVNLLLGGIFQYRHTPRFASWLAGLGAPGKSLLNLLNRIGIGLPRAIPIPEPETADRLNSEIPKPMVFEAAGLGFARPGTNVFELRTSRVFFDPPAARCVFAAATNAQPLLTYLVNLLRAGTNTTPYSMVTAAGPPWTPADLREDEIIVSQWLAEDLQVKPGDEIALTYFDPESGARLIERTNTFRVRGVVPMEMPWADRTLMPDFPGIEKAESTSEWDAGFPLVHKIRQKDEDYWKQFRGTPKAFVTLAAGQKMWANRFGDLTAIRFWIPTNTTLALTPALSPGERENRSQSQSELKAADSSTASEKARSEPRPSLLPGGEAQGEGGRKTQIAEAYRAALETRILAHLKPEELGLRFEPVREQALKAAEQSQDFGGLFLGFSFFLIVAALLLMAMLFQLGLEQRAAEIGTLLALGFTPKQVRRLLLGEGVALAFLGGVLGALGGMAYARAMLHGLATVWRDAVGASALGFHATPETLAIGLCASTAVSAVTIGLALRKFVRRPAAQLLTGEVLSPESTVHSRGRALGAVALAGALGLVGWTLAKGEAANAGAFFGAGTLVLVAGLSFVSAWLGGMERGVPAPRDGRTRAGQQRAELEPCAPITLASLALRGCARRRKRSLATVAMLACGSFLIVSIGVFRLDANRDATKRGAGTGGFALIGESTMPVVQDLNSEAGRDFFALNARDLDGVSFVPFRVREGDEASCLNLNRAQKPRLLGVKPEKLGGRFSFAKGADWRSLMSTRLQAGVPASRDPENRLNGLPQRTINDTGLKPGADESEIPAIGDANSIQWAMHKKVGDTIDYVDEGGQPFKVRIVGAVANSILQGQLIIDEAAFVKRFPGESGYRMFLIDAPSNAVSQVSAALSRSLQDVGLELTPAAQRLAQFNAVQNTYLGTFQVLGGLGLLLGSVGLGIVVMRNVLERRSELAVLLAVGFRARIVERLVFGEHGALLALGLALGIVAAAVAVLPALLSPAAQLPYASLALTLGAVLINGALWTWMATRGALRGNLLAALRNE